MSKPNLLAIWAKHEHGEGATNEELGHLIERFESLQDRFEQAEREAKAEALTDLVNTSLETRKISKFQAAWIRGLAREYTQGPRKIVGAFATPETKENKN